MQTLFPRLHPVTIALLFIAFVICELFGGDSGGGITYAVVPAIIGAGALIGGGMVASNIIGGIKQARENRAAIRRFMKSPEYKALSSEQRRAALRSKMDNYGMSNAAKRKLAQEAGFQYTAMVGKTEADLQAGSADPTKMAQKRELVEKISEGGKDVAVKSTAAAEQQSGAVAQQQKAQDLGTIKSAAALRQSVESGKAAAANQATQAVVGGIQQAGQIAMPLLATAASQPGPRTSAAGVNMGATAPATQPAAGTVQ